ncbi:MAG TPA: DUF3048 domain-containing protein [Candidatus Pacearchaeota archaeon]|nr:DUF3048 domain-containing protein [Candidatus Pacearchaeota archaeon]HOK93947.1 DUF3048 domain-containing protein [Candidatus Pacearchaeota archaeon]HPO75018.1 DUF3048 domain-containing protein [Candidatus Pacearchaeota archaeon]
MKFSKKQKKIISSLIVIFILGGILFFLLSRPGNIFQIEGEAENLTKPKEKNKSPFSGISCKNNKNRAFGIVLGEYPETMPLSSPGNADIIIEAPVDNPNGIARLIAIFQCQDSGEIGSIRSARPFMADLALGYDLIFASWGGPDSAISRIKDLGVTYLDARVNPFGIFFRKQNVPTPHNGFALLEGLKKTSEELGMRQENYFEGYQFLDEDEVVYQKASQEIEINNYYYPVKWVYDQKNKSYLRFWNGEEMIDRNTAKQIEAKNVVLMRTEMSTLSEGVINIKIEGSGNATIYQGGREIQGTWKKESPQGKLTFFDQGNKEIQFIPGQIWIEIIG